MDSPMGTITMRKAKQVRQLGLVVVFGLAMVLTGCSGDKEKSEAPTAAKSDKQSGTTQAPGGTSQTQPAPATPAAGAGACSTLLTTKCTVCHNLNRICEKLGKKSTSRWQRTIDRMIDRGAKLNPDEKATLLVCLDKGATNDLQDTCR